MFRTILIAIAVLFCLSVPAKALDFGFNFGHEDVNFGFYYGQVAYSYPVYVAPIIPEPIYTIPEPVYVYPAPIVYTSPLYVYSPPIYSGYYPVFHHPISRHPYFWHEGYRHYSNTYRNYSHSGINYSRSDDHREDSRRDNGRKFTTNLPNRQETLRSPSKLKIEAPKETKRPIGSPNIRVERDKQGRFGSSTGRINPGKINPGNIYQKQGQKRR